MSGSLSKKVMVLNKHWHPIRIVSVERAIKTAVRERAAILDEDTFNPCTWDEWCLLEDVEKTGIRTTSGYIRLPLVIILNTYDKVPAHKVRPSRKNVWVRDKGTCQYSGRKLSLKDATVDHVIPSSKGGGNDWCNLALCDPVINRKKGNKTNAQAGLTLKRKPVAPKWNAMYTGLPVEIPPFWLNFLPDLKT